MAGQGYSAASSSPESAEAADGGAVYASFCASCHGPDGAGNASGPALESSQHVARIQEVVLSGDTAMPAFRGELTGEQIRAVSEYVAGGIGR